ncbi:MAG TPA: Tol-Pal system protein TolB, partial [Gemmatimonadetes bacterium]|nr:Tol-Pal system protein TolB [Gemmatimonadota bacterium]
QRRTWLTVNHARDHLPSWSPDGAEIVFASRRDGNDEIYVIDRDGEGLRNLTNDPGVDVMARFLPDGRSIVFVSNRGGAFDLYLMSASGRDVRKLEGVR